MNKNKKTGYDIYHEIDEYSDAGGKHDLGDIEFIPVSLLKEHPGYTTGAILELIEDKKRPPMYPSQKKLLELLQKKAMSLEELVKMSGLSPDGIRGRLSEMRKLGYEITKINGMHHLGLCRGVTERIPVIDQILDFITQKHMSGRNISIHVLKDKLKISDRELIGALKELRNQDKLSQFSAKIVRIYQY